MSVHSHKKPVLLITGASGLLGSALCRLAVDQWTVYGTYMHHHLRMPEVVSLQADLTHLAELSRLLIRLQPRAVIHAAAQSQVVACESQPKRTRRINVATAARLAEICAHRKIDYLFVSTDLVFDGRQAPYREGAQTGPLCEYARQKVAAEQAVLSHNPDALVCRLPLMFGLAPNAARHFTVQMLSAILSEQPVDLFVDEFRTPVDTDSAASGLLKVIGNVSGILHLGGRTRISRYDLGCLMAKQLHKAPTMLRPVSIEDLRLPVARAPDCSLVSDAAYDLGYAPTSLEDATAALVRHHLKKQ